MSANACSPTACAQAPSPGAPFLPHAGGAEGLALGLGAPWAPHAGSSCLTSALNTYKGVYGPHPHALHSANRRILNWGPLPSP